VQPLQALVSSNGNLKLAAERAQKSEAELLAVLYDNFAEFQLQMRAAIMLQMFGTWYLVQEALKASLDELEPRDLARTYTNMSEALATLSEPPAKNTQVNLLDSIILALPEEQREAFKALIAKPA